MAIFVRYGLIALALIISVVLVIPPFAASLVEHWSERDVEARSLLAFNAALDEYTSLLGQRDSSKVVALSERMTLDEQLLAVGFCNDRKELEYATKMMPNTFSCSQVPLGNVPRFSALRLDPYSVVVSSFPIVSGSENGHLVLLHDFAFAERRGAEARRWIIIALLGVALLVTALASVFTLLLGRRWVRSLRRIFDEVKHGDSLSAQQPDPTPFSQEFRHLLRELKHFHLPMERPDVEWTPGLLRTILAQKLPRAEIIVVSNREPYIHNREADGIVMQTPASGLVAAIEPIMRACSGTWIAHGSGSADRETVDRSDRIRVPPDSPSYTLRRVWLNDDEQNGYYYGFANEGLWPLCHMAFVRPNFRESDWEQYKLINARYAQAVVEEAKSDDPIVLVQDYHFALLPGLLRKKLPRATIVTFWHIPWPNPETFGICPWKEEIINGLLGSSVIGFHTQIHCSNFLNTVDQSIEARIDRDRAAVIFGSTETLVRSYPISIEWPPMPMEGQKPVAECRAAVRQRLGLADDMRIGVGVERFDYTKGILDRLLAIDTFLSSHPEWEKRFAFVQVAAPTRTKLTTYSDLQNDAVELVRQINARHGSETYQPVSLIIRHHEPHEIFELFRAADLCIVSSLHDGMNLIAKEFVAARDDEEGVLLLSTFAGASQELSEALIVNPHDIRNMADAIEKALRMSGAEKSERMRLMREIVRSHNVYRWAGQMLLDAADLRKRKRIIDIMRHESKRESRPIRRHSWVRL